MTILEIDRLCDALLAWRTLCYQRYRLDLVQLMAMRSRHRYYYGYGW
jgi:hypothetical protein